MFRRTIVSSVVTTAVVATTAVALALGAVSTALAGPSGPKVTIRIEGAKRTLLATKTVRAPLSGSITKDGAPQGKCPADSAAGALNVATKGSWGGSWSSTFNDYLITKILGDTESGTQSYWEILVNNVAASTGACEITLHAGDRLLFAAVPLSGTGDPLVIKASSTARVGKKLKVTVDAIDAKGVPVPLAGAIVTAGGARATTNAKGVAKLAVKHAGTLILGARKKGYVRAATVRVRVAA